MSISSVFRIYDGVTYRSLKKIARRQVKFGFTDEEWHYARRWGKILEKNFSSRHVFANITRIEFFTVYIFEYFLHLIRGKIYGKLLFIRETRSSFTRLLYRAIISTKVFYLFPLLDGKRNDISRPFERSSHPGIAILQYRSIKHKNSIKVTRKLIITRVIKWKTNENTRTLQMDLQYFQQAKEWG